ncbi:MAG: hypothetical protein K0S12_696, partial [Bacteroidetes bacterium]|nr:hypothetical protein [Bacteroidota bacterium]
MFTLLKKIFKWSLYIAAVIALIGTVCFFWVEKSSQKFLYDDPGMVPACRTGLVLGTSA